MENEKGRKKQENVQYTVFSRLRPHCGGVRKNDIKPLIESVVSFLYFYNVII